MELVVVLEKGPDSDTIIATVPQIPGCHTQGRDKAEAMRNIREAIELCLEDEGDVQDVPVVVGIERIQVPG